MQKRLTSLAALGTSLCLSLACSEDMGTFFNPDAGALVGLGGLGGRGGAGGAGGSGGLGAGAGAGLAGSSGMAGGEPDAGRGAGGAGCRGHGECDDLNPCTMDRCERGACMVGQLLALGSPCGSALSDACTEPDTCDGAGTCQPNHTGAQGTPCGSSASTECSKPDTCDGQGVCQAQHELAGTPCGSSATTECTNPDTCDSYGQCSANDVAAGTPCGSGNDDECANPDACGSGLCLANDEGNGTACTDGSCTLGACIGGQPQGCPSEVVGAVPFSTSWSSVGKPDLYVGGCDSVGTPDYALVFTAPSAGTFRFAAAALVDGTPYTGVDPSPTPSAPPDGDAVLTVAQGSCAGGSATQLACNDDVLEGNLNSQLDVALVNAQVVTVYLNELTQTGGGTGTLNITLLQ